MYVRAIYNIATPKYNKLSLIIRDLASIVKEVQTTGEIYSEIIEIYIEV